MFKKAVALSALSVVALSGCSTMGSKEVEKEVVYVVQSPEVQTLHNGRIDYTPSGAYTGIQVEGARNFKLGAAPGVRQGSSVVYDTRSSTFEADRKRAIKRMCFKEFPKYQFMAQENEELQDEVNSLRTINESLIKSFEDLKHENKELSHEISKLSSNKPGSEVIQNLEDENKKLREKITVLESAQEFGREEINKLRESNKLLANKIKNLKKSETPEIIPNGSVFFDKSSTSVNKKGFSAIKKVFDQHEKSGGKILIIGFTDKTGNFKINKTIAHARAKAVAEKIISMGTPKELIEIDGQPEAAFIENRGDDYSRRADIFIKNN